MPAPQTRGWFPPLQPASDEGRTGLFGRTARRGLSGRTCVRGRRALHAFKLVLICEKQ